MPTLNKMRRALTKGHGSVPAEPRLTRTRIALTAFFAMDGFLFAGWVVRIPAIKAQTGAGAGTLGLALLGVSAGAVAFMMIAGRLCRRFGSSAVTAAAAAALSLSIVLPPLTRSATALGLVLLVFGAAYGALNVAMNSAAVALIGALRRPVMPGFHAAFSLGGMLGAGLGGLLAGSLSATVHLLLLAAIGLLVTVVAGRALCGHPVPEVPEQLPAAEGSRPGSVRAGRARRLVLVFGLIALCTAYGEGAMADWGALHLSQDLGAGPGTAAAGYAVFALAMTVGRLSGTAAVQRFGADRALIAGGTVATAGMLLGALAPTAWAACAGFAVAGLGLANIFPIALARAGETGGPDGVAVASTVGYGGMLLGPPAIGFLAEAVGLPAALTTVALLAALAAGIACVTRGARTGRP
ncbi:MFS transporter [Streptomyces sp. ID38640]|uniref:MFS transporter n=1 Tax=Streptomyces sp. ID38640 TaxID=1265399 RepID=UPI00140F2114|nr:MFS transporter [Streptomyces sp. ID38640]